MHTVEKTASMKANECNFLTIKTNINNWSRLVYRFKRKPAGFSVFMDFSEGSASPRKFIFSKYFLIHGSTCSPWKCSSDPNLQVFLLPLRGVFHQQVGLFQPWWLHSIPPMLFRTIHQKFLWIGEFFRSRFTFFSITPLPTSLLTSCKSVSVEISDGVDSSEFISTWKRYFHPILNQRIHWRTDFIWIQVKIFQLRKIFNRFYSEIIHETLTGWIQHRASLDLQFFLR